MEPIIFTPAGTVALVVSVVMFTVSFIKIRRDWNEH